MNEPHVDRAKRDISFPFNLPLKFEEFQFAAALLTSFA
jgi:hypothetical protein